MSRASRAAGRLRLTSPSRVGFTPQAMRILRRSSARVARLAAGLLPLAIAACSAAPREAPVSRMSPPEDPPAIAAARKLAAEQFYQGKSLALAGDLPW